MVPIRFPIRFESTHQIIHQPRCLTICEKFLDLSQLFDTSFILKMGNFAFWNIFRRITVWVEILGGRNVMDCCFTWYGYVGGRFFLFVTMNACDRQTEYRPTNRICLLYMQGAVIKLHRLTLFLQNLWTRDAMLARYRLSKFCPPIRLSLRLSHTYFTTKQNKLLPIFQHLMKGSHFR